MRSGILALVLGATVTGSGQAYAQVSLGRWDAGPALLTGRDSHAAGTDGTSVCVSGGINSNLVLLAETECAQVVNGSLSSWTLGTPLPDPRQRHAAFVLSGWMYIAGGDVLRPDGGRDFSSADVLKAPLSASGLGAWTAVTSLPAGRQYHAALATGGVAYVVGGWDGGVLSDVWWAALAPDGGLGPWTQGSTNLPVPRMRLAVASTGTALFALGGEDNMGAPLAEVDWAPILDGGALGAWLPARPLPAPSLGLGATAYAGTLFAVGGYSDGGLGTTAAFAAPFVDGGLGPWQAASSLPFPGFGQQAVQVDSLLISPGAAYSRSVFTAALSDDAGVGSSDGGRDGGGTDSGVDGGRDGGGPVLTPDGGDGGGAVPSMSARSLAVGCGCTGTGSSCLAPFAVLLMAVRRRSD